MAKGISRRRTSEGHVRSGTGSASGFGGAAAGVHAARNQATASDVFSEGLGKFLEESQKGTPKHILKGKLFEYIEAARFNRNAARTGSSTRATVTAKTKGGYHDKTDVLIDSKPFQLKASEDAIWLAKQAIRKEYDGMDVVVPSDMVDKVNQELERMGEARRVTGKLDHDGIDSAGTTSDTLGKATDEPDSFVRIETAKQIGREAIETGAYAAAAAALIGGAISALRNGIAYRKGEIDGQQALANVGKDSAFSGARGGATGVLGVGVRHGAKYLNVPIKSNVAAAVAAAAIDVGVTVYDFAQGEVSAQEAGERIGQTGCATVGGVYGGAAAGAVLGPVGAVVGSMVGYMGTAWVYQACLTILKQGQLAEEETARLEALCAESAHEWNRRRQEFETSLAGLLEDRQLALNRCLGLIEEAIEAENTDNAVQGLALLTAMTGSALKFEGFEDFKQFMEQDTGTRLVI